MRKLPKYLRGSALLLAILLATIIALGTAGLLLLLQYHRQYAAKTMRQERLQQNLASATNLLLAGYGGASTDSLVFNLFDGERDSVILSCRPWGIFDLATAWAYEGADTIQCTFLMGKVLTPREQFTLHLADEHLPLSLSGRTFIKGDVFLPGAGTRKSYIENEAYAYDEEIHDGTIYNSADTLPGIDTSIINRLYKYLQPHGNTADSVTIDSLSTNGSLLVAANHMITVRADAKLDNVLLFSPHIRFEPGFGGRLQAFARDSIVVGSGCRFDYPSALGLINIPKDSILVEFQPYIQLDSASMINGVVFTYFPGSELLLAKLVLAKETTVHGQVYADGLLELRGRVNGTTVCRRFTLQTPSSLYDNFILGGVMDFTALSRHYAGSPLLNRGRQGRVAMYVDTNKPISDEHN